MSRFLEDMERGSRRRFEESRARRPLPAVRQDALSAPPSRELGLFGELFDVIAEIKPRSPAEGELGSDGLIERMGEYERGGAAMVSVLTEPDAFSGSLDLLAAAASQATVPVMRKDFLVDPYQVYEARGSGADGVLLILRLLDDTALDSMLDAVNEAGMFALLEAFDRDDLSRAVAALGTGPHLLTGVNSRDLESLEVDPATHASLSELLPPGRPTVAESGIVGPEDVRTVAALGYRAALIGSALMRSEDPAREVISMIEAGRAAVGAGAR